MLFLDTFWISLLFLPLDSEGIVNKEAQFTARVSEFYQLRRKVNEQGDVVHRCR